MKKQILTIVITFVVTLLLFGGNAPVPTAPKVEAQSSTAKANLITLMRQDAKAFLDVRASFKAHKASYDGFGFSWIDGDFTGANSGITATQFTTGVSNLDSIFNAFDSGGSLSVGLPTGVNRLSSQF